MNDYTKINSIEDIDPRRISIRNINRKYIDPMGNRYATRFNLDTRKVEIVRLASDLQEAKRLRAEILRDKRRKKRNISGELYYNSLQHDEGIFLDPLQQPDEVDERVELSQATEERWEENSAPPGDVSPVERLESPGTPESSETPLESTGEVSLSPAPAPEFPSIEVEESPVPRNELTAPPEKSSPLEQYRNESENPYSDDEFHPAEPTENSDTVTDQEKFLYENVFLEEMVQDLSRIRERQYAVINNLKKSGLFDKNQADRFNDVSREFDVACWQPIEQSINYYRELYSYPRPLSYYVSRLMDERKERIERMENEEERFTMVRRWELQDSFEYTFTKIIGATRELDDLLRDVGEEDLRIMKSLNQNMIKDTMTLNEIVLETSRKRLDEIQMWKRRYP